MDFDKLLKTNFDTNPVSNPMMEMAGRMIMNIILTSFNLPTECLEKIDYATLNCLFSDKLTIGELFYINRIELKKEIEKRIQEFYVNIDNDIDLSIYDFHKVSNMLSYGFYSFTCRETNEPIKHSEIKEGIENFKNSLKT